LHAASPVKAGGAGMQALNRKIPWREEEADMTEEVVRVCATEALKALGMNLNEIPKILQAIVPMVCKKEITRVEIANAAVAVAPQFQKISDRFFDSLDSALEIIEKEGQQINGQYAKVIEAVLANEKCPYEVQWAACEKLLKQQNEEKVKMVKTAGGLALAGGVVAATGRLVAKGIDAWVKTTPEREKTARFKELMHMLEQILGKSK
jgi:hypothetical protein